MSRIAVPEVPGGSQWMPAPAIQEIRMGVVNGSFKRAVEETLKREIGIHLEFETPRTLETKVEQNLGDMIVRYMITQMPPQLVPAWVHDRTIDVGFTGEDQIYEFCARDFGEPRLKFDILGLWPVAKQTDKPVRICCIKKKGVPMPPKNQVVKVASEYQWLTKLAMRQMEYPSYDWERSPRTSEVYLLKDKADFIVDVYETGSSVNDNDLEVVCEVLPASNLALIARRGEGHRFRDYFRKTTIPA